MLKGKSILITGGTGSFGSKFTEMVLEKYEVKEIVIFSRDEMKQWFMMQKNFGKKIRFVIGDVRDKLSLKKAMHGIDYVVHAAATKIVPLSEINAFECVKTNIFGSMNVIDCALESKVSKVIALSTDKASAPINLYGATKLASDKLFVAANINKSIFETTFSVVRYGNVMGSRGSVIPFFLSVPKGNKIPITDLRMTRFMITLEQAVELVWFALQDSIGGEIYVKKIPSMKVVDIAKCISPNTDFEEIGIRPGEKLHEQMIGVEDAPMTLEYENYFKIIPSISENEKEKYTKNSGVFVESNFLYTSENNSEWMSPDDLKIWLEINKQKLLQVK